jgi:hypothetical protein
MKLPLLLTTSFFLLFFQLSVCAQSNVPLKYEKSFPKNLYSAPTAVLINYITNKETTEEDDAKIISRYSTQLLTDNQQLKLQLLHFADKNVLLQPVKKQRLLKQYDSLKIENLLFLDITDIGGQGAQGSFVFLLTPYNHTSKLMSPKQRAYTMQEDSYEKLIRDLTQQLNQYSPNYFHKAPAREPQKPALSAEPKVVEVTPQNVTKASTQAVPFPTVSLSAEDQQRGNGGAHRNFYYYLGGDQRERNAGFFGQHLKQDISASSDALKELKKYKNYKIAYLVERAVFVGAIIGYMSEVYQQDGSEYFNNRQKVYIGLAGGSLIANVIISRNTNQHMTRAIDEYNAFATMRNNTGFHKFKPDAFGIGAIKTTKAIPAVSVTWNLR